MTVDGDYNELQRAQDADLSISVFVDEQLITESIRLRPRELFKYIHHISRDKEREAAQLLPRINRFLSILASHLVLRCEIRRTFFHLQFAYLVSLQ